MTLIAGFDVPDNGATACYLKFTLPSAPTEHIFLDYYGLSRPVDHIHDTWNHRPARFPQYPLGQIKVIGKGDAVVTGTIPCHLGTRMDFELVASKPDTRIHWFGEH